MTVDSVKKVLTVSLELNTDNAETNKQYFDTLKENFQAQATTAISENLVWSRLDEKKMSKVSLSTSGNFFDASSHTEQFAWFFETVNKFSKFFRPKVKTL